MQEWMSRIVDGTLDPVEGARLILRHGWIELRQPVELNGLVALLDDWEDFPGIGDDPASIAAKTTAAGRRCVEKDGADWLEG